MPLTHKCECGGEIKPIVDFFKDKKKLEEVKEVAKSMTGIDLEEPRGYNCIVCGQVYGENFEKMPYKIGWL